MSIDLDIVEDERMDTRKDESIRYATLCSTLRTLRNRWSGRLRV